MSTSLQDAEAKITGVENEIEQVKNDIAAEAKITGVENEIEQVKNDIAEAVKKIEEVEKQIGDATTEKEKERLCKKEEQLRKKEEQLRKKEEQLRDEKNKRLDEKNKLLDMLQESEKRQRVEAGLSSLQNTTASSREETEWKPYFFGHHNEKNTSESRAATTASLEACAMLVESNAKPELNDVMWNPEYQVEVLKRWAGDLGPVARRVFNPVHSYRSKRQALADCNRSELVQLLLQMSGDPKDTASFHHSHSLILMEVASGFNSFVCLPGSVTISRELRIKNDEYELEFCDSLLQQIKGVSKALVFEPYSHSKLLMGEFTAYKLGSSGGPTTLKIDLRDYSRVDVQDVDSPYKVEAQKYYVPQDPCFPVIDAWTHQLMFQMTVSPLKESSAHPIKSASKKFLAIRAASHKQAQDEGILVFVVPRSEITSNEQSTAAQWQPQALVSANGGTPTHDSGPQGGWNRIRQYVLFL
ncbi:hypothetical protein AB1Y20_004999 [Prymnesium parvum]|uniref:Uncharacterized protein n=1 Tax=Prymnesium parvum TaxID=97485 RepID=A0AB34J3E7_PRYPA